MPAKETPEEIRESLFKKVKKARGCWIWLGAINPAGYGTISFKGKIYKAHRVIYELSIRKVPSGKVLDHKCRNRSCVNPKHLRVVTNRENVLSGVGITAKNALKTHCARGHRLTKENVTDYREDSNKKRRDYGRKCIPCMRYYTKIYRFNNKEKIKEKDKKYRLRIKTEKARQDILELIRWVAK